MWVKKTPNLYLEGDGSLAEVMRELNTREWVKIKSSRVVFVISDVWFDFWIDLIHLWSGVETGVGSENYDWGIRVEKCYQNCPYL